MASLVVLPHRTLLTHLVTDCGQQLLHLDLNQMSVPKDPRVGGTVCEPGAVSGYNKKLETFTEL